MANKDDTAFQTRLILIPFDGLSAQGGGSPSRSEYDKLRHLMSALAADFDSLRYFNVLDHHAIMDCVDFIHETVGKRRDRNCASWGLLLYFMLLVNRMFQVSNEGVFVWVIETVTNVVHHMTQHHTTLRQFIISMSKLRSDLNTYNIAGPMQNTIYWHNLRTVVHENKHYVAVRVESCVTAIKNGLGVTIDANDLRREMKKEKRVVKEKRVEFYDTVKGWPICEHVSQGEHAGFKKMGLEEWELTGLTRPFDAMLIDRQFYDEVVALASVGIVDALDYKSIILASNLEGIEPYNFYEHVTSGKWFGFRALGHSTFSQFCGSHNKLFICPKKPDAPSRRTFSMERSEYFTDPVDLDAVYSVDNLHRTYGFTPTDADELPDALRHCPFKARDAQFDVPLASVVTFEQRVSAMQSKLQSPVSSRSASHHQASPEAAVHDNNKQSVHAMAQPSSGGIPGSIPTSVEANGHLPSSGPINSANSVRKRKLTYKDAESKQVSNTRTLPRFASLLYTVKTTPT